MSSLFGAFVHERPPPVDRESTEEGARVLLRSVSPYDEANMTIAPFVCEQVLQPHGVHDVFIWIRLARSVVVFSLRHRAQVFAQEACMDPVLKRHR